MESGSTNQTMCNINPFLWSWRVWGGSHTTEPSTKDYYDILKHLCISMRPSVSTGNVPVALLYRSSSRNILKVNSWWTIHCYTIKHRIWDLEFNCCGVCEKSTGTYIATYLVNTFSASHFFNKSAIAVGLGFGGQHNWIIYQIMSVEKRVVKSINFNLNYISSERSCSTSEVQYSNGNFYDKEQSSLS